MRCACATVRRSFPPSPSASRQHFQRKTPSRASRKGRDSSRPSRRAESTFVLKKSSAIAGLFFCMAGRTHKARLVNHAQQAPTQNATRFVASIEAAPARQRTDSISHTPSAGIVQPPPADECVTAPASPPAARAHRDRMLATGLPRGATEEGAGRACTCLPERGRCTGIRLCSRRASGASLYSLFLQKKMRNTSLKFIFLVASLEKPPGWRPSRKKGVRPCKILKRTAMRRIPTGSSWTRPCKKTQQPVHAI